MDMALIISQTKISTQGNIDTVNLGVVDDTHGSQVQYTMENLKMVRNKAVGDGRKSKCMRMMKLLYTMMENIKMIKRKVMVSIDGHQVIFIKVIINLIRDTFMEKCPGVMVANIRESGVMVYNMAMEK